jgi:DHA1 family multidrug resistance protein-like MFS transporter
MKDIVRDSTLGQLLRFVTGNRILKYYDETSDFTCPGCYHGQTNERINTSPVRSPSTSTANGHGDEQIQPHPAERTKMEVEEPLQDSERGLGSGPANPHGIWKIPTQVDMQRTYSQQAQPERAISRPIDPVKTSD